MKTILIGFGNVAAYHINVLNELNCDIVGVFSRTYDSVKEHAQKFGIDTIFKTFEEIQKTECDFFTIITSAENNCKILKKFIPLQKPILIEKPVGFDSSELQEAISLNQQYHTPIMVGVNRRFYSIFHQALDYLDRTNKKINAIYVEAPERFSHINNPKNSENTKNHWMYANSIHCIDLIRFFIGNIKEVTSYSNASNYTFNALGKSTNNTCFIYNSNWKSPGSWSITLYADEVKIVFNPLEKGQIIENNSTINLEPSIEDIKFKPGFYFQLKHFLNHVLAKNEFIWPCSNLEDHKHTIDLIDKLFCPTK